MSVSPQPLAPRTERRRFRFCTGVILATALLAGIVHAQERRYTIAVAIVTEEPDVTLEGTGFTGRDVRESFALAARGLPVDLVFYDNRRDGDRALASVDDAIGRRVDLYVAYFRDAAINARIAEKLKAAHIPVVAVNTPVPGAPLYTVDNAQAGRIAGEALAAFAARTWRGQSLEAVIIGPLTAQDERVPERAAAARQALRGMRVTALDTAGNLAQVAPLLAKFLAQHPVAKVLVAAMDDATVLAAKATVESAGRGADSVLVSHGCDRSVHGGQSERKEIDPNVRNSILLGSVAFYLDRYGYDVLPLALKILRGEIAAARTTTAHRLITSTNVWIEYPPTDLQ